MRLAQLVIGFGVVGSLIVGTPAMSSAVPPPPPNPSDSDIAAADSQVSSSVGTVSALINQVASANEQLSALDNEVAIKREDVNKTLVDLQNARGAADSAAQAVGVTKQALKDAKQVLKDAQAAAKAIVAEAKAAEVRYETDAEGNRKLNDAENMRNDESRRSAIYEHLVKTLPQIIRETVKPMENIESIKILQVDGLPGLNSPSETGAAGGGTPSGGNIPDQVVNSAMKYRTQVAFVDGLMEEIGLPLKNLGSAGGMSFRNFPPVPGAKSGKDDD